MLNLVSVVIGLVGLAFAAVAFLPLLGWANWLVVPLALIGAAIGMSEPRHRGPKPQHLRHRGRSLPAHTRWRPALSRDPRIDAYIANAQPFARPILETVRERVHAVVPDVRGDGQVEHAGLHGGRKDPADHARHSRRMRR